MEGKILDNIVLRMKKDQLYNKNYCRLKETELKNKERQICMNEENILHWDDNIHKLMEKINGMKNVCVKNTEKRV